MQNHYFLNHFIEGKVKFFLCVINVRFLRRGQILKNIFRF